MLAMLPEQDKSRIHTVRKHIERRKNAGLSRTGTAGPILLTCSVRGCIEGAQGALLPPSASSFLLAASWHSPAKNPSSSRSPPAYHLPPRHTIVTRLLTRLTGPQVRPRLPSEVGYGGAGPPPAAVPAWAGPENTPCVRRRAVTHTHPCTLLARDTHPPHHLCH